MYVKVDESNFVDAMEQGGGDGGRASLLSAHRGDSVRVFHANFAINWAVLKLIVGAGALLFFTFVVPLTDSIAASVKSVFVVVGLSLSVLILFVAQMVYNESKRVYDTAVAENKLQEGVFVFPTRDVVVRFSRPFFKVDQEFPAGSISLVQANEKNNVIYILWADPNGIKLTFNVDGSRLVDNLSSIAREMNQLLGITLDGGRGDTYV